MQQPHRILQEAKLLPAGSVAYGRVIEREKGLKAGPFHTFPAEFLLLLAEFPVLQQPRLFFGGYFETALP